MTLRAIAHELRLIAGELRGYDDMDQWLPLERLAEAIEEEQGRWVKSYDRLAERLEDCEQRRENWP